MTRICIRSWCRHEAVKDGRECAEHLNETLRETRPQALRNTSPWVARALAGQLPPKAA